MNYKMPSRFRDLMISTINKTKGQYKRQNKQKPKNIGKNRNI